MWQAAQRFKGAIASLAIVAVAGCQSIPQGTPFTSTSFSPLEGSLTTPASTPSTRTIDLAPTYQFNSPRAVAVDKQSNAYVTDHFNNFVVRISPQGVAERILTVQWPSGIAVDEAGNLYVSSQKLGTVAEFKPPFKLTSIGTVLVKNLEFPGGIAISGHTLYVADTDHERVVVKTLGSAQKIFATGFTRPTFVATSPISGDVYVADSGTNIISIYTPAGVSVGTLTGALGGAASGLAVNSTGALFVSDSFNNQVYYYNPTGSAPEGLVGSGLSSPLGLAVDSNNNIYVADLNNNAAKEIQPWGTVYSIGCECSQPSGIALSGRALYVADSGKGLVKRVEDGHFTAIGTQAHFVDPEAVALDSSGNVYVADTTKTQIVEIKKNGTIGQLGAQLVGPSGVTVDASNAVFAGNTYGNSVQVIAGNGGSPIATLSRPAGVAFAPGTSFPTINGRRSRNVIFGPCYATQPFNNAVVAIDSKNHVQQIGSGFSTPFAIAVDSNKDVFVADTFNNALKEVLPNGQIVALGSGLQSPRGVAVDAAGNIYLTDTGRGSIEIYTPPGVTPPSFVR